MSTEDYEKIYLNQGRLNGRFRIADTGLGWKPAKTPGTANSLADKVKPYLLPSEEVVTVQWSKGCKGFELRINTKNKGIVQLDGFTSDDLAPLKAEFSKRFNASIDVIQHSLRGWNWGQFNIERNELKFSVNGIPSFEVPYKRINNTNLTSKNEIAIEFNNDEEEYQPAGDEIVEMRFFVPDYVIEDEEEEEEDVDLQSDAEIKNESEENDNVKQEEGDAEMVTPEVEKSAAQLFFEELKEKADVGENSADIIVSFEEILFNTPRGRYDIDIYKDSIRLRGKTYEYKLQTKQIQRIFSVPAGDESNHNIVLSIDPPLRQGQTTYPSLVLQFNSNEEIHKKLSISDEEYEASYKDILMQDYEALSHVVVSHVLKGITNKKVIVPGDFSSEFGQACLPCAYKANQGYIYPLEKSFLFLNKPPLYIQYSDINLITISRVGESSVSSKSFDMDIVLRNNGGVFNFTNIPKEDQIFLEKYLKSKNLKVKNEDEEQQKLLKRALKGESEAAILGSDDNDDDDSDDVDFDLSEAEQENADENLSEEFDSNAEGADSDAARDSDLDDDLANEDEDEDMELSENEEEPPLKKSKTTKE